MPTIPNMYAGAGGGSYPDVADVTPTQVGGDSGQQGMSYLGAARAAAPKVKDWLGDAVSFLMFGHGRQKDGTPPDHVVQGAGAHLASMSAPTRSVDPGFNFSDTNYPQGGGGRSAALTDAPVDRLATRDRAAGIRGGGNRATPSSPSRTMGQTPVTAQPQSNDPNALKLADLDRVMKDPAMDQLKAQLAKLDGKGGEIDLTPLAALSDSWSGGHLAQAYDRPLTTKQIEGMKTQIAEQLARRQGDLEWHLDRNREMAARTAMMGQVAQTAADSRETVGAGHDDARLGAAQIHGAAGAGKAPKVPPENDPGKVSAFYKPMVTSHLHLNYDDPTKGKAIGGAAVEADQQVMQVAHRLMQMYPQQYPSLKSAYGEALQGAKDGHYQLRLTGLRPRRGGTPGYDQEAAGGD